VHGFLLHHETEVLARVAPPGGGIEPPGGDGEPSKGPLPRSLVKKFLNYLRGRERKEQRRRKVLTSYDALTTSTRKRLEPRHDVTPEDEADGNWRRESAEAAHLLVRRQYETRGKLSEFEALVTYLVHGTPATLPELAAQLGKPEKVDSVRQDIHRLRERHRRALETVMSKGSKKK
jgi:hypothetical protein